MMINSVSIALSSTLAFYLVSVGSAFQVPLSQLLTQQNTKGGNTWTRLQVLSSPETLDIAEITYTMAGTLLNKKWILKQNPNGKFDSSRDAAELVEEPIDLGLVPDSNIIVEVRALSVNAFIRTMVRQEWNEITTWPHQSISDMTSFLFYYTA